MTVSASPFLGRSKVTEASGATKRTWVYVVEGARQEPHLGDHDAEDLGIVSFSLEGRTPKEEQEDENCERRCRNHHDVTIRSSGISKD